MSVCCCNIAALVRGLEEVEEMFSVNIVQAKLNDAGNYGKDSISRTLCMVVVVCSARVTRLMIRLALVPSAKSAWMAGLR